MEVRKFDEIVTQTQIRMGEILDGLSDYREEMDVLKDLIGNAFAECTSEFEEQTLTERLHETFELYLTFTKNRIGA